jgi:hypothetical protein
MYNVIMNTEVIKPLNLINYNKATAKETLLNEMGWNDYGGKHYESFYTKFYQAYILPQKFKIDKRKAHLSNLILAKEITKDEAVAELRQPLYNETELASDTEYFLKKMSMDNSFFENYMHAPRVEHTVYGTQKPLKEMYPFFKLLRPFYKLLKK